MKFKKFKKQDNAILENDLYVKNLLMDHMLTNEKSSKNLSSDIIIEKTVSNKPLQLYKTDELHVKDMIVINEDISASNGIVHSIGCVMFVQPSEDDPRLTPEQRRSFKNTSCCMHNEKEVNAWKSSINAR